MEIKKPIFCALAFGSASINAYGEYIPCCNIRTEHWKFYKDGHYDFSFLHNDPYIRINAPNLKEVRSSLINGEWPKVCTNCEDAEKNNIGSMRTIWNKVLENHEIPMVETIDNTHVRYLDLTFGTKCNSKCMTCSSSLSDFWTEEWNSIWRITPEQQGFIKRVCIDDTSVQKLVNDFPNVVTISFIGGEPTISEEHIKFLKLLIELNRSKKMRITYVTNLTGITEELIDIWKNFESVHMSVSIDGYQKVNEYIRFPFKWQKIENNLRKYLSIVHESVTSQDPGITKFSIGLSCTVSLYNAIQCMDLFKFWLDTLLEYKTDTGTLAHNAGCFVNRVSHPSYALVNLLSVEYRKKGIEKGNEILNFVDEYLRVNYNENINQGFVESVKLIMKWLEEPQTINSTFLSQSKHFITESDVFRNRKLKNFIPELDDELQKIWDKGIIPGDYYIPGTKQEFVANQLIDGPGYIVKENIVPLELINSVVDKLNACYPVRASSKNKQYAERDQIKNLPDICVWWSQTLIDSPEILRINEFVQPIIRKFLPNCELYSSEIVTIMAHSKWINPHVDTPNRFKQWNFEKRMLGVQVVIALEDMNSVNGVTGIVPHSQKQDFDISLCYQGRFNEYFLQNLLQPKMPKGSFLAYNSRVLHSSMPNSTSDARPALLINYLDKDIVDEVRKIDNIWTSNGK